MDSMILPGWLVKAGDEEDALRHYRRVRDEIKAFVEKLPEALEETD